MSLLRTRGIGANAGDEVLFAKVDFDEAGRSAHSRISTPVQAARSPSRLEIAPAFIAAKAAEPGTYATVSG